jgi:cytochrome c peroxidase
MAPEYRTARALKIVPVTFQHASSNRWAILRFVFFLSLAGNSILSGCHSTPRLTPQEMEGKHLYQARCAHCHEENDLELKKVPPSLHDVFARTKLPSGAPATDLQVRQVVLGGKGMMPAFNGRFDEAQMSALLAYLHTGLR